MFEPAFGWTHRGPAVIAGQRPAQIGSKDAAMKNKLVLARYPLAVHNTLGG